MSTEAIAAELGASTTDVVRSLCAAGVEVRLGIADRLAPALLRRRYVDEKATAVDLAREAGTTPATVTKYLKRAGIAVRGRKGRGRSPEVEIGKDLLRREYIQEGRSADSIAKEHGTSAHHVLNELRRHGLPVRTVTGGSQKKAELQRALTPAYLRAQLIDQRRTVNDLAEEHGTSTAHHRPLRRAQRYRAPRRRPSLPCGEGSSTLPVRIINRRHQGARSHPGRCPPTTRRGPGASPLACRGPGLDCGQPDRRRGNVGGRTRRWRSPMGL